MMTTMMTMLLTTVYIHQVGTCKQNVRKQKQFGRYTGTLPYYLDLPDGQLMIGGGQAVGTVGWTLSLSLITKGKKSFLDCLSFYLHGEDQIKKAGELREVINLSYRITPVGTHRLSQTLSQTHSGLLRQAYLEPSAIVCVCVCCFLAFSNQRINRKKGT